MTTTENTETPVEKTAPRVTLGKKADVMDLDEKDRVLIFTDPETETEYWTATKVGLGTAMEFEALMRSRGQNAAFSVLIVDLLGNEAWQVLRHYGDAAITEVAEELVELLPEPEVNRPNRATRRSSGRSRSKS